MASHIYLGVAGHKTHPAIRHNTLCVVFQQLAGERPQRASTMNGPMAVAAADPRWRSLRSL